MLMRCRVAEIDMHAVAQVLGDKSVKSRDHIGDHFVEACDPFTHVLGVKTGRRRHGPDHVADHDRQLSPLRAAGTARARRRSRIAPRCGFLGAYLVVVVPPNAWNQRHAYHRRVRESEGGTRLLYEGVVGCPRLLPHLANEAEALARQRLDQPLRFARVADCTAGDFQASRQCGIRNNAAIPYGCNDVVFADDALAVADQVGEQIQHLRCNRDGFRASVQFPPVSIQHAVVEQIAQIGGSTS